jgi:hypothetical protein
VTKGKARVFSYTAGFKLNMLNYKLQLTLTVLTCIRNTKTKHMKGIFSHLNRENDALKEKARQSVYK